jgi:hypothetical protein
VKPFASAFLVLIAASILNRCFAQEVLSVYKPKNKTEQLVIAKLRSLPEIKDWYASSAKTGKVRHDILIGAPDSSFSAYRFQVGLHYTDEFRTYFWMAIDPKNFKVYYIDFDDEGMQDINLEQWRYWRDKLPFKKTHKWAHGKLLVLKD